MLLSNVSLLELLQKVLECTWTWSFPSEPTYLSSEDALLSSGWLLAASLLIYQHRYNTEVRAILVQIHGLVKILKKNSFLAGESGLFWPGICLSLLLFCYCLQVVLYCISPAGLEANMLLKSETQITAIRDGQKCWDLGGVERKTPYPALQVQTTFFFRIEQKIFVKGKLGVEEQLPWFVFFGGFFLVVK